MNALGLTYSEACGPPNFWTELCGTPSTTCVPTVARSPWGHLIAACLLQWQGQATIPASRHISGSNLNPNAWGLLEPSPGGRVTAGDTTLLMVRGRGVTTSHHCTQDPHECRKSSYKSHHHEEETCVKGQVSFNFSPEQHCICWICTRPLTHNTYFEMAQGESSQAITRLP